jgi:hypothetical protein
LSLPAKVHLENPLPNGSQQLASTEAVKAHE